MSSLRNLSPNVVYRRPAQQHVRPLIGELAAEDKAIVLLLDLIAMHGIDQEIGEIGKQIEVVVKPIGRVDRELPVSRCQAASSE